MTVLSSVCNSFQLQNVYNSKFLKPIRNEHRVLGDIQSQWPSISRKRGFFGIKERKQVITQEKRSYVLAIRTSPIPPGRRTSCRSLVFLGQLCLIDCSVPLPSFSSFFDSRGSFSFFYYQPLSPPCHPAFLPPFRKLGITSNFLQRRNVSSVTPPDSIRRRLRWSIPQIMPSSGTISGSNE